MSLKRRKNLARVAQALKVMKTTAEAAAAATAAEGERLEQERQLLIGAYNGHGGLHHTFAGALSKALREASLKAAVLRDREREQRAELSALALRLKQAERLEQRYGDAQSEEAQRRALGAAIERAAQASGKRWRAE